MRSKSSADGVVVHHAAALSRLWSCLAVVAAKPLPPLNGNVGVRQRGCGGLLSLRIAGAVVRADAGECGD
jgi:hypothetical protein